MLQQFIPVCVFGFVSLQIEFAALYPMKQLSIHCSWGNIRTYLIQRRKTSILSGDIVESLEEDFFDFPFLPFFLAMAV